MSLKKLKWNEEAEKFFLCAICSNSELIEFKKERLCNLGELHPICRECYEE